MCRGSRRRPGNFAEPQLLGELTDDVGSIFLTLARPGGQQPSRLASKTPLVNPDNCPCSPARAPLAAAQPRSPRTRPSQASRPGHPDRGTCLLVSCRYSESLCDHPPEGCHCSLILPRGTATSAPTESGFWLPVCYQFSYPKPRLVEGRDPVGLIFRYVSRLLPRVMGEKERGSETEMQTETGNKQRRQFTGCTA